jgi:hypothetical protein
MKARRPTKLKKRNFAAKGATNQKAGPMKDKRPGRRGSKNETRDALSRLEDV